MLPDEIGAELLSPAIRYIFFFRVFRPNCKVNMMPDFVKEDKANTEIPQGWDQENFSIQLGQNLVHAKLDIRKVASGLGMITAEYARFIISSPSGLRSLNAIPS
jgi:hypothetical protein